MVNRTKLGLGTKAIHVGSHPDPTTGAVIPPLSLSTTFKQADVGDFAYEYSRSNNPTRERFETALAAVENGRHALTFASGSAATATVLNMLEPGSHILSINDVYGGTYRYFTKVANNMRITVDFIELVDSSTITQHIKPNTKLIWIETPTNPTLKIVDIAAISSVAHQHNLLVVVDNTFMSPVFQTPLDLGADMVIHSITKFINGHSDVVMGAVVLRDDDLNDRLRFLQNSIGAIPSPFDCYQAHRGLKTLHLRMKQHEINALAIATALEESPYVERVIYPGLESHPQHDIAKRQMRGFGGMLSFYIKGDEQNARKFLRSSELFSLAESLGGVESLAELPSKMTHGSVSPADRAKLGITDTLIRLSAGIEDTADLVDDVLNALELSQNL
ncbi:Cystathionine gamma-lyase [Smittium mucronatum]|uniref:cystathionine gamma-lyase n=1 Tax=Smittium mucronatum TaxID=133383 RepID=A0A1R0GVA1_9FUNG|nr:Cystathionine gamma-lyase [Smittium mucronatum]